MQRRLSAVQQNSAARPLRPHQLHCRPRQEEGLIEVDLNVSAPKIFGHILPMAREVDAARKAYQGIDSAGLADEIID